MSTSKFLHLFSDSKSVDPFEIQSTPTDAIFSYANKPLKFNGDVQYKNGVTYTSLLSKFGLVDQSVTNEATFARSAELVLRNDLTGEVSLARLNENTLHQQLVAETVDRNLADTNFQIALAGETTSRQSADTILTSALNFEIGRAQASESVLNTSINTEKSRSEGVETGLRTDLNKEITDRVNALSSESGLRSGSDIALGLRIDAEILRATNSEVGNFQLLDGYIQTEKTRAMLKESLLTNQVNFMLANVDPVALDSLSEIVNKVNSSSIDLYNRVLYLEQVVSTLRGESLYATVQPVYVPGVAPSNP